MKVKVNITKGGDNEYFATTNRRRILLFSFQRSPVSDDLWYFSLPRCMQQSEIFITGKEFPLEYFKRLCQALWLITVGGDSFPEIELTARAKKLLEIK